MTTTYAVGSLVQARGREWVVQPGSDDEFLVLQPLGGGRHDVTGLHLALERVQPATFPLPTVDDIGDARSAKLLRTAVQLGFRSTAGPFRSLGGIAVEPRAYQLVPLMLALRQDVVRLLISDDVGIGKTVEAGLIASELLAQGSANGLTVLCSPALAEQWHRELIDKFNLDATLVLTSTAPALQRGLAMDESLFDRHPITVVSTDFIKSPTRRHEFLNHAPDLVIVDEAHTAVQDGSSGGGMARHQRHELLKDLAKDRDRHLVLVTATPHSGKDEGFRNLIGLLDPELADLDLETVAGRTRLARHFIQRRRKDIRSYLDEETNFPSDREIRDLSYKLTPAYRELFDDVLAYARGQVQGAATAGVRGRVRWWSALALLRALSSSPAAASATLRSRARSAGAIDATEADVLGRASVLDTADDEAVEGIDTTPGADLPDDADHDGVTDPGVLAHRRWLTRTAKRADLLVGPTEDAKLALLIRQVKDLLADGFDPIVFCRFIDTADYVAEHLQKALKRSAVVGTVTGTLPPSEREQRIRDLTANENERHVLVATDCLSEGVNLQDSFQAVVHYDLAWNPTRHEQREGRVDRFGQSADVVRALTIYGQDTKIDGLVLDILIKRHRAISAATGVSVPVPEGSDSVVEALLEGLLLRGHDADQLELDLQLDERAQALVSSWESAAAKEKAHRTKYQQESLKPDDVAAEIRAARAALGTIDDVVPFVRSGLLAYGAHVTPLATTSKDTLRFSATTGTLDPALRDALPLTRPEPIPFHAAQPAPRKAALLQRTDPYVAALARHVLDGALDSAAPGPKSPARRSGIMRTDAVARRTTVLLVRHRFHLDLPSRERGSTTLVAEDCSVLAFAGAPSRAEWLPPDVALGLLDAQPVANIPSDQAVTSVEAVLAGMGELTAYLEADADVRAAALAASHTRVRRGSGEVIRGLSVRAEHPVDVLGVYVYLPVAQGAVA